MSNEWMWGVHGQWLMIVWIVIILVAVLLAIKLRVYPPGESFQEAPLEVLERRFAEGNITREEFERRKRHLLSDETDNLAPGT